MKIEIEISDRAYNALSRIADALEKLAPASENDTQTPAYLSATERTLIEKAIGASKPSEAPQSAQEPAGATKAPEAEQVPTQEDTAPWEEEKTKAEPKKKEPEKVITDDELRNVAARTKEYFNSTEYVRQALMACGAKSVSAVPADKRQQFVDFLEKKMYDELPY